MEMNVKNTTKLTLAIFGIKISRWWSLKSFPCWSARSRNIFKAHRLLGNEPVAITGFRMLMDASTGRTAAILEMMTSTSRWTCQTDVKWYYDEWKWQLVKLSETHLLSGFVRVNDFEKNQFEKCGPILLHVGTTNDFCKCMQRWNHHDCVLWLNHFQ